MPDLEVWVFVALLCAAFAAGWLDAIGGGGGLIQLPALLIALPADATALALGTNKVSSIVGTSAAARNYARQIQPDPKLLKPMMLGAFIGSLSGTLIAVSLNPQVFRPIIFVVLCVMWVVTLRIQVKGEERIQKDHWGSQLSFLAAFGIGFYDGAIGPGTGIFLILLLVLHYGLSFLQASGTAKFINIATNFASILVFGITGNIWWLLGALMAVSNLAGGIVGSRLAIKRGSGFVRRFLLWAIGLILLRLGLEFLGIFNL
ncbi:MAG: hypothetical protein RIS09_383 [Actinomycetota bacterium]|jgi:uncharacterized membrane protein YfcA